MPEMTAVPLSRNRGPLIALFVADAVSIIGNRFTTLTVPWFVLVTTGSVTKTGITGAVTALSFIASFFGGTLVDRLGFKRVSVVADLTRGIAVALILISALCPDSASTRGGECQAVGSASRCVK